jgi:hypothetical protein
LDGTLQQEIDYEGELVEPPPYQPQHPMWVYVVAALYLGGCLAVGLWLGMGLAPEDRSIYNQPRNVQAAGYGGWVQLRDFHWALANGSPSKAAHLSSQRAGHPRTTHPTTADVICASTAGTITTASTGCVVTTTGLATSAILTVTGGSATGTWTTNGNATGVPLQFTTVNGTVSFPTTPPLPAGARYHAVTDTYFDENGNIVGRETRAHAINPAYCHPGAAVASQGPMPLAVRQLIAHDAAVEPVITAAAP